MPFLVEISCGNKVFICDHCEKNYHFDNIKKINYNEYKKYKSLEDTDKCIFCDKDIISLYQKQIKNRSHDNITKATNSYLIEAPNYSYNKIKTLFDNGWKLTNKPKPTIHKIWKIVPKSEIFDKFMKYKKEVEENRNIDNANDSLLFHATSS